MWQTNIKRYNQLYCHVNTLVANALPFVATKTSATRVLKMRNKWLLVLHEEEFQLP